MRILMLGALAALLLSVQPSVRAEGKSQKANKPQKANKGDEAVVKAVRAALSEKREEDRDKGINKLLAGKADWPSVREGLIKGRYHQRVLPTMKGRDLHSGKHLGRNLVGLDQKERGFSFYLPTSYDSKKKIPLLVYLHHSSSLSSLGRGKDKAGISVTKFRAACERDGIIFVAPYTSQGAEWWTPEGKRLVAWTIQTLKGLYNIDENRIGLAGALDGAEGVWYLAQNMPGTFASLLPMSGNPFEITGMIEPLCLGTLDRMPVLMGVPGEINSNVSGKQKHADFLKSLKPLFDQGIKITTAVYPRARNDFSYLEDIVDLMTAFVLDKKRRPLATEVDVATANEDGLAALWLESHGWDKDGDIAHKFKSTVLPWKIKAAAFKPQKRMGVTVEKRPWQVGVLITRTGGGAGAARLRAGDVLLEIEGKQVHTLDDVKKAVQAKKSGDEVRIMAAREVRESKLAHEQKLQGRYDRVRLKAQKLRDQGKKPNMGRLWDDAVDDEASGCGCGCGEDDDDEELVLDMGGDDKKGAGAGPKGKTEKTVVFVFERHIRIRNTHAGPLVHAGFGLGQDRAHRKEGVRIGSVYAGSRAARAGFKPGDVIVGAGGEDIKNARGLAKFLAGFDFEKEGFLEFTVRRLTEGGKWGDETTRRAHWERARASRVDVQWNQKENSCKVLAHRCAGFTLRFTDELVKPGKDFHLFINGVPYRDCVDPASMPEYPVPTRGSDSQVRDRLYRMRRERAKVKGWTPDLRFAIEQFLEHRDRELVVGAERAFDMTKMNAGMKKYREYFKSRHPNLGKRVKEAYDRFKAKG